LVLFNPGLALRGSERFARVETPSILIDADRKAVPF